MTRDLRQAYSNDAVSSTWFGADAEAEWACSRLGQPFDVGDSGSAHVDCSHPSHTSLWMSDTFTKKALQPSKSRPPTHTREVRRNSLPDGIAA